MLGTPSRASSTRMRRTRQPKTPLASPMSPQSYDDIDPGDQRVQIALLAMRVENLGREKEALEQDLERECAEREYSESELEKRIAKMERSFQRGAGIIMVLPVLGGIAGVLLAYGKAIFAPWTGKP